MTARSRLILYVQYADPAAYPPVERSAWQFLDLGWRVRMVGTSLEGEVTKLRLADHPAMSVKLLPPPSSGGGRVRSFARFAAGALAEITSMRPDVVYCSDDRSYPIGIVAGLLPGVVTALHEHDSPLPGGSGDMTLLQSLRRRFARRASICILPQAKRAADFARVTGAGRVIVAFNCPSLREVEPLLAKPPRKGLVLWHHGSLGPTRLPMSIVDALAQVPDDVELRFAGYETVGTRGYIARLLERAAELGIADRVQYIGALPRDRLFEISRGADVGVVVFGSNIHEPMVGASVKPFDYLACGLPLLVNATQDWREFFIDRGVARGCVAESAQDIAAAIRWYRDNPAERAAMAAKGYDLIKSEWNYEACYAPVVQAIAQRLGERRGTHAGAQPSIRSFARWRPKR